MQGNNGITATTPNKLLLDVGVLAIDGVVIGATRGGIEWNLNRTLRAMGADGALGDIKRMKRRETIRPTLSVNSLELTLDNLTHYVAGARQMYSLGTITVGVVTAGQTVTINDITYTAVTGTPVGYQFQIGGSAAVTAANLRNRIVHVTFGVFGIDATVDLAVITLTADPRRFYVIGDTNLVFATAQIPVIEGGSIRSGDFKGTVTITGTMPNGDTAFILLKNCLAEGDWSLSLADKDEAVANVTFVAHIDPAFPDEEPWNINIS